MWQNKTGNSSFNDAGVLKMVLVFHKAPFLTLKKCYQLCIYIWELFLYDKNGIKVMYLIRERELKSNTNYFTDDSSLLFIIPNNMADKRDTSSLKQRSIGKEGTISC